MQRAFRFRRRSVLSVIGFRLRAITLRHYGLTLVMIAVLKLAVLDISSQNSITRVLALAVAGIVCFLLSLAYNKAAADSTTPKAQAGHAPLSGGARADGGAAVPATHPGHGVPASPDGVEEAPAADGHVAPSETPSTPQTGASRFAPPLDPG